MGVILTTSPRNMSGREMQHLDFNYKLLKYFGLWPHETPPKRSWEFIRSLIPGLLTFRAAIMLIFHSVALHLIWEIPHLRSHRLCLMVGCILVFFKLSSLISHKNTTAGILESLEAMNGESYFVDETCEVTRAEAERWSRVLSKNILYSISIIMVVVFVCGRNVIAETFTEPVNILFPESTLLYYLVLIIFVPLYFLAVTEISSIVAMDVTWLAIGIQMITQFHILGYKLENIRKIVKQTAELRKFSTNPEIVHQPEMETSGSCSSFLSRDPNTDGSDNSVGSSLNLSVITSTEETEPGGCRPSSSEAEAIRANSWTPQHEIDNEMEKYLASCVEHHLALIRICAEMQRVLKPVLRCQILLAATTTMMTLYISILSSKVGGLNDAVLVGIFFFIAAITELLILSILCDKLTEKSALIREAAYACDWLEATEGFKRSLRIIMCRTSKPVVMKAMGIPISLRSFRTMMRAVYYTHTLSLNIIKGNKIVASKNFSDEIW